MKQVGKVALVTGANGFLGSRVARYLAEQGWQVRGLVRRPDPMPELEEAGVALVRGDVTDADAVRAAVQGVNYVVHCAAVPGPDHATSLKINGEGTAVLAEAALAAGCERFVHISTVSVYDHIGRDLVDEETPFLTEGNPYEMGKIAAERAVEAAAARGLKTVVLRPPAILGAHPTSSWGFKIARGIAAGKFPLFDGGAGTFSYLHVENLARAVLLAAESPAAVGQAYTVLDGQSTWGEYVEHFRGWLGLESVPSLPAEQGPPYFSWRGRHSGAKLVRELGYAPVATYADALAETKRFLEANGMVKS